MFEKSKITWHLTNLEAAAGTSSPCRQAIAQMAASTGLLDRAVRFTKDNGDAQLGAAYLVMAVTEMALETNAPPMLMEALSCLLPASINIIQAQSRTNPAVAIPLLSSANAIQIKLSSINVKY